MSKPTIRYKGRITDEGKYVMEHREKTAFQFFCQNRKPGRYYLTITKEYKARTIDQNAYYWVLMTIFGNEVGYTKDEAHDLFRIKFLTKQKAMKIHTDNGTVELSDHKFGIPKSSSLLSRSEFVEYVDKIRMWCATSYMDESEIESLPVPIILPDPTRVELKST